MISDIEQVIHKNVEGFLEQTAKEFDIPMAKLKENWKAHLASTSSSSLSLEEKGAPEKKKKRQESVSLSKLFCTQTGGIVTEEPGVAVWGTVVSNLPIVE